MDLDLIGKRAVVCGSSQGIGKATAIELASLGASITLVARNAQKLEAVKQELPSPSGDAHHILAADFSDPEGLESMMQQHLQDHGPAHILINNTGGPPGGPALEAGTEEYRKAFTQHLICNQVLARTLVPSMKTEGYGRIINVISTSVKQPIPGLGVSNTIRGAVANWAKTLAGELGPHNITVNNVLPGPTNTQRLSSLLEKKAENSGKPLKEVTEQMMATVPLRRAGEPEETASAIAFLASPAASYINGINVPVDGGRTSCL